MTASIENSRSSLKVLLNGLAWFREASDVPVEDRVTMLETLARSFEKCVDSLAAQIRFYESAKGTGRAYWIKQEDGSETHVDGQQLATLRLALPGAEHDAVIHGKPEALAAVAAVLSGNGHTVTGPAGLHDIAAALRDAAFAGTKPHDPGPGPRKAKRHGNS